MTGAEGGKVLPAVSASRRYDHRLDASEECAFHDHGSINIKLPVIQVDVTVDKVGHLEGVMGHEVICL